MGAQSRYLFTAMKDMQTYTEWMAAPEIRDAMAGDALGGVALHDTELDTPGTIAFAHVLPEEFQVSDPARAIVSTNGKTLEHSYRRLRHRIIFNADPCCYIHTLPEWYYDDPATLIRVNCWIFVAVNSFGLPRNYLVPGVRAHRLLPRCVGAQGAGSERSTLVPGQ